MKVLVIGANNSGKGTLLKLLGKKTNLETIGCSSILNKNGLDIATGKLLPDSDVNTIMANYLSGKNNFILDGYPRTLYQNAFMKQTLFEPDLIVVLNIAEEEVVERAVGRRVCENCSEIYNLNGFKLPKTEGVCDKCSGKLVQREDDKEETVRRRYNEYIEQTYPIVNAYRDLKTKAVVWEFDTTYTTEEISDTVAEYINYMMS